MDETNGKGDRIWCDSVVRDLCARHRRPLSYLSPSRGQPIETPQLALDIDSVKLNQYYET